MDLGFDAGAADSYNGPAGATTQPPTPSELAATAFDAAALGDLGTTNAVFDFYVNARFQLQGLETGLTYRLTFFGSHKFSTDDATVYGLCTDNTYATTTTTVSLNVQVPGSANLHNSNTVAVISSATPRSDGKLYVAFNGANGNNGYLNAMKLEWEKVQAAISGVSASQSANYGTSSVTLTGIVGAVNVPAQAGEVVGVTINGVTSNATVGAGGAFSVTYPVSSLVAGAYTITYAYAGSTVLKGATNTATTLTVNKLTSSMEVSASQSKTVGSPTVTLTGQVSAAGSVYPANGSTVGVTINGVTQNATVSGGVGGFSLNYNTASLAAGTYTITYAYAGNATTLLGVTNNATSLTILPDYQTVLIDMANGSAFRSVSVSNPDSNGRYWNSVYSAAFYADMVDKSNVVTRVDLGFDAGAADSYNGPAGATTQPPTPSELAATAFDAAALGDLGTTNAVFDFYVNARFQLQGLETGLTYRLTFFGSHKFSTDDATVYGLCTDNTYATTTTTVSLNVQVPGSSSKHNSNTVAVIASATPRSDGKLYVAFNGANGNNGYLNAMKLEWEKVQATISGVSASQSANYGTSSVTLTGIVGAVNVPAQAGEVVGVTINGVTSNATVGAGGAFSVTYPVSSLVAGAYTITYAYAGSTVLKGATNTATTLTVNKLTSSMEVSASQSKTVGSPTVTLTGQVSAAGSVYPANGSTVGVTINGVTQNATVSGGVGGFSLNYNTASLAAGTYTITYAYAGNATTLLGVTNNATSLTILPDYQTVLIDMANGSAFRSVSVSNPDSNGRYWNSVYSAAFYADMVDKSNVVTRVDLGFDAGAADSYNGPAGATTQPPTPSELAATAFDAAALGDLGTTNAVFDFYVNARFQLQGLETGLTYRLTFFGSHKFSTDDATVYGLCTDNTYATTTTTVSLNVQVPGSSSKHNSNTVAVIASATPRSDGKLYVAFNGANGNNGYLNAMKLEWEKVQATISGVSASQSANYGTSSVTLTGIVGAVNVPAQAGEVVGVTINGVTSNATVGAGGAFSVTYPVSSLVAGAYTITYAYAGSTVLKGATNTATTLTVNKLTSSMEVSASQSKTVGSPTVTLTGQVSAAGSVYPANGSTVGVTINGVTQNATVSGGVGGFSLNYNTASLAAGTYTITYAYAGNATTLLGVTNNATSLTILPDYQTVLIDMANGSAFRSVSVSNPDSNGRYWNSVYSAAFYADMVDKSNVVTRVDLGFDAGAADSYNGPAGATTQPPTPSELAATAFDAAALGDLGTTNAVFDFYVNARFQLQGLETGLTYRLTFFGSHKFSTDDATVYGLCTDNTYATTTTTVSLNVQVPGSSSKHNSNTVAVIASATPRSDGKLYVAFNGANGNSGYLNAMKLEWEKAQAAISGVSASQSANYGTSSVTLTGIVGAVNVPAQAGEVVGVTINGVTSNATVGAGGAFSVTYPVSSLAAGVHTITYAYAGSTVLKGATNTTTTLTVTKLTPTIGVSANQSVEEGLASVTLTGLVSAAGGVYPANGSTVGVTINGITQNATIAGGAGAFSMSYTLGSLGTGVHTITYAYAGNATSLNGATNASTTLTVLPRYETVLVDMGNSSVFRSVSVMNPDSNGRYWNSVHSALFYADMVDKSNVVTRVDLGFDAGAADSYNGPAGATTQPPTPSELAATAFDAAALGDLGTTNAVFDYYVNARFQLQGLETGLTYRLTFFGSHKFSTDDATVYGLCTDNTYATTTTTVSLNVQVPGSSSKHNSNTVAAINLVSPQADGKFYVAFNGANGNSGYLNAMKVEWVKAQAAITGVSASQSANYGTSSVTLTGIVGAVNVPAQAGEVVGVTINGVTSNATVGAGGAFSVTYPMSTLAAGMHTITYAYAGSTVLKGATNATTTLTVTKLTPTINPSASQSVEIGTATATLTGQVSAAGSVYPANGSIVSVSIHGVSQNATISGGVGGFSLAFPVSTLTAGVYDITYAYAGNATSLNGTTNSATTLTVSQGTRILVDFGRHDGVNGNATASPDVNGHDWNNLSSRPADNIVTNGTRITNLVTIGGVQTPVSVEITSSGWKSNGRLNGGLISPNGPSALLLGDFAIETATEDYIFAEGSGVTETFRINGLNPSSTYNLRFFGTRGFATSRQTTYTVNGNAVLLTTSGAGIGNNGVYNGNDDEISALNNLVPNGSGQLNVSVTATTGGFGYLGILEITDNSGFCSLNTAVTLPHPGNKSVLATGSATLSFTVTGSDSAGCTAPTLDLAGLPSGATFTSAVSGNVRTGYFNWTPTTMQVGTYPLRVTANDVNEAGSTGITFLVYVGESGEGSSGGVPNSQTNWHVAITNLLVPSSGNATVVWAAVDGVTYDIYTSPHGYGAGSMTWTREQTGIEADGSIETSVVSSATQRYYQVVVEGGTPSANAGLWALFKPVIKSGFNLFSAPVSGSDLLLSGAFGSNLAAVLTGSNSGVGDGVGDELFVMNPGGTYSNLYLDASKVWRTSAGGTSTMQLNPGQGFMVLRNSGSSVTPVFSGPVGNSQTKTNTINTGYNIIGLSEGEYLNVESTFDDYVSGNPPTANYDEANADLIIMVDSDGSYRRLQRLPDGTWYDLKTGATATVTLKPGQAYYYYRVPASGTMRVRF